jgi:cysteinyl-tRNA synthetase
MLGILQESPDKWLGIGQADESTDSEEIEILIDKRKSARDSKDFSKADEIRQKLNSMGIEIEDTPDGTIWRTK